MKNESLIDYTGDFEMIGKLIIGLIDYKTNVRFKNMDDFGSYIITKDVD